MPGVLRMIEHGDAHDLVAHRPGIIAPFRAFAPGRSIPNPGALHDVAQARLVLADGQAHGLGDPNAHRSLLGVTENNLLLARLQSDVEVEQPFAGRPGKNAKRPFIGANHFPARSDPLVLRADHARVRA